MTTSRWPLQVFLAHSSQDKATVRDIYHLLKLDGFIPWLDEVILVPGQDWEREIKLAVQRSNAVAVFLSRNSVDHAGYIHKEIAIALDHAQRQPEGAIFIIPIRLEECTIPERLKHLHWIQLLESGFSIGQAYFHLQRSLILQAGLPASQQLEDETDPWWEKRIRDSSPVVRRLDGCYLIRGMNPNGGRYYGTGNITFKDDSYTLTEQIGTHEVVYNGYLDESKLVFAGKGYTVTYIVGRKYGVLLGEWGEGGGEELIPASPFFKTKEHNAEST